MASCTSRGLEPLRYSRRKPLGAFLLFAVFLPIHAARLPIRVYTTAEGLARNRVNRIVSDSRGFVWLCTAEGLSRFDGYTFVNYGTRDGLASRAVNDILEARDGSYWVATAQGLCRMQPKNPQRLFTLYRQPEVDFEHGVNAITQDHNGVIWAATDAGLYRVTPSTNGFEWVDIGLPHVLPYSELRSIVEDRNGSLWIGGAAGLRRRFPDGRVEVYPNFGNMPENVVEQLLADRQGQIWLATRNGLYRLVPDPRPSGPVVEHALFETDGMPFHDVKSLAEGPDGTVWAGCLLKGIASIRTAGSGRLEIHGYGKAEGLSDETITALGHDREGNLWAGGSSGGAMRIVRNGFTSFNIADGLGSDRIIEVFEDRAGEVCAAGNLGERAFLSQFDGDRFHTVVPSRPEKMHFGWAWSQVALQARSGLWWTVTPWALLAFPNLPAAKLATARPIYEFKSGEALPPADVFRVMEDSQGAIWTASAGTRNPVTRWDPVTGKISIFPTTNEFGQLISAMAEDRAGNVWLGLYGSGLVRYRHGQFGEFSVKDGIPAGIINSLYADESGRLWIGSGDGGLGRVDSPDAEHPSFRTYDSSHGLSSDTVGCLTSDQWGRLYAGTGRGLDRLDPSTDRIKHYTTADGLANDGPMSALRDRHGALWFATTKGVSRLVPHPDETRPPPPILITGLTIAGRPYPVSQLGETSLTGLEFTNGQVQIEFTGLDLEAGESLDYQYRIEGAGGQWSVPARQRNVNLAALSPGSYQFLVRAVDSSGQVSAEPAAIAFRIPPPFWGRLWFQALVAIAAAGLLYLIYRIRLGQILQLEHMRTRIATDLHDDIGASLSQIAILSEVAHSAPDPGPLDRIASISREMIDSMADIVWAINPERDTLHDLTRRMRQFAGEVLIARDIGCTFDAEGAMSDLHLDAELRRQVFLIFKESVNNAGRHSAATHVEINFALHDHVLVLEISDDGVGFDPSRQAAGHGLTSICRRAASLGGKLTITSSPGAGTTIHVEVPLPPRWRLHA